MSINNIINEVEIDILDVFRTNFAHIDTKVVPTSDDQILTFERNAEKRGKIIETCVLYIDIRDSVEMSKALNDTLMGKIYTAFIKSVIKIGRYHSGSTRNIIGDRVMIVFPSQNCFQNAVSCAISLNHVSQRILKKTIKGFDFRCGIGIDFGKLKVIKVGIQRNGTERAENKGLVWSGKPANLASRLTDVASKTLETHCVEVTLQRKNNPYFIHSYPRYTLQNLKRPSSIYSPVPTTERFSLEDYADIFQVMSTGEIYSPQGKVLDIRKIVEKTTYPPILISERVFEGLKASKSTLVGDYWNEQKNNIKNIDCKVYGADVARTLK